MQQKLKKIAIPTIYVLSVVAFGLSIYFIQLIVSNVVFQDPEPNLKYVDKEILEESYSIPVIGNETTIIRPYLDTDISIAKNYYDYQSDVTNQENAIIYYENTYMQNSGVDYRKEGTFDVVAVLDGTVINVKEDNILGNIVEIRHNNEIISVYQSLSDIIVKIDDTVLQGQIIGKSGVNNINKQLKEHLHFELYYKGMVVNPENYFGKKLQEL